MPEMKESVVLWPGLHPRLEDDMEILDRIFIRHAGRPFFITSARDGVHSEGSLHYAGKAVDGRSKDIEDNRTKYVILEEMRQELGNDYDILLENVNEPQEHYHIEFQPKPRTYLVNN